ncbi:MAG: AAA domain-containing protein [Candidatus Gastranaerophilales bacterium]|nr:AAA domain-containing protein [Candidatus Gastranaerophilales bacterium]
MTDFDAKNNVIKICDTEKDSELYINFINFLNDIEDINLSVIKELEAELKEKYYHPLDRNDAYDFLKILIHKISSKSKFIVLNEEISKNSDDKLFLTINPVFFKRKRIDGTIKTLEEIINNINKTGFVPNHIIDIVTGGKIEDVESSVKELDIDELLAETSGESYEILLSKEANREQLEIAKRIEKYNAVCVQGPPGTGKTHTIANLLGHFLAQGKSVLVTSHTSKALKVLKEKVAKEIQNLCVTVLDDGNKDMERSIDGIGEYLSKTTSAELERKLSYAKSERDNIKKKLDDIRKKIYIIKKSEFEPIVYNGKSYSPSQAASFVSEHEKDLSYIPGKVELNKLFPLTGEELQMLYHSNSEISEEEDIELTYNIPNPKLIFTPSDFISKVNKINECKKEIAELEKKLNIKLYDDSNTIKLQKDKLNYTLIENPNISKLDDFLTYISKLGKIEEWMIYAIVDGKKGKGYKARWENLINSINDTVKYAESFASDTVAKKFNIPNEYDTDYVIQTLENLSRTFLQKGTLSWINKTLNKDFKYILENFKINNKCLSSHKETELMKKKINLIKKRYNLKNCWNFLISRHNFTCFEKLDKTEQERVALNYVEIIQRCINWYSDDLIKLQKQLKDMGLNYNILFTENNLDSELDKTKKYIKFITGNLLDYLNILRLFIQKKEIENEFISAKNILVQDKRQNSNICNLLIKCIDELNTDEYNNAYLSLSQLFNKYETRKNRIELLEKLKLSASDWALAIETRAGIHGLPIIPDNIHDAWKWKQLAEIIDDITSKPFEELQQDCVKLSKELREKTAECCAYSAWYHLLKMTESNIDMKQALQGWKASIKKIGKGTGKNVPIYRKAAKEKMAKCQKAVPAWIMPINKALETLIPGKNSFDVIIIDEASQSDIKALSICYMAKKIIIVGDDKQVSPSAVGIEIEKMNTLIEKHIKDVIPNWELYEAKTSLYDIAKTTFQPLMLKEHFRCVPEIIGYSNRLSYDYKIKPLRDSSSSNLKPAVIEYRIDGERNSDKKINILEAEYIVSLILSCIENDKYKNATFGVISLLGKEQACYIQNLLLEKLDNSLYEHHNILCGDASDFQGDERDVIFLSMVDSNNSEGPLTLMSDGAGDSRQQRYNVAASRAKDQMWLIHSLDAAGDLKSGDLRRGLIEYMKNPNDYALQIDTIEKNSDSPFEEEVCKTLVSRGYNVTQQWRVGAYKIDMVISYQDKKIALECDGEKFHSGDRKIREDMERQTILERLGWKFIRIRGSEYYRNKEKTINKVINELMSNGIYTEQNTAKNNYEEKNQEIEDVKIRAEQIRKKWRLDKEKEQQTSFLNNVQIYERQTTLF